MAGDRLGGLAEFRAGIVAHPGIEGLALPDDQVERRERLLQRRFVVGAVMVVDVDVVQAQPAERLVEAGHHVFPAAAVAVRARPHVVAGLGRDDQLVPRHIADDLADDDFAVARRRAVIVGQVEVRHAVVECVVAALAASFLAAGAAEALPETKADLRQHQAAPPATAILHPVVTLRRKIGHRVSPFLTRDGPCLFR